jgi:hypothetical protein
MMIRSILLICTVLGASLVNVANPRSVTIKMDHEDLRLSVDRRGSAPLNGWGVSDHPDHDIRILSANLRTPKETYLIPYSAYADLFNPYEFKGSKFKDGYLVTVKGGDASASYTCIWSFKKGKLLKRRVVSGEFPEDYEETVYSYSNEPD